MIARRGVPQIQLLVMTVLAAGAGWQGYDLGYGRDHREAVHYRQVAAPLAGRLEIAIVPWETLVAQNPVTRNDVILHGGAVDEIRDVRPKIDALGLPEQLAGGARALRDAVDDLDAAADTLVSGAHEDIDSYLSSTFDEGFQQYDKAAAALRAATTTLFGTLNGDELAPGQGPTSGGYLDDADRSCHPAVENTFKKSLKTAADIRKNAEVYASAFDALVRDLRASHVTGPLAASDAMVQRELTGFAVMVPAMHEFASAVELQDQASLDHARGRVHEALVHSRALAAFYSRLGASWCVDVFTVPVKSGTSST